MKKLYLVAIAMIIISSCTELFAERSVSFQNKTAYPVALNIYYKASGHKNDQNGTTTIPANSTGSMSFPDSLTFKTAFMNYTDANKVVHNGSLTDDATMQKYVACHESCRCADAYDPSNPNGAGGYILCTKNCGFNITLDSNNNPKISGITTIKRDYKEYHSQCQL